METTWKNSLSKGKIGEKVVMDWLELHYVIYPPKPQDCPHPFDLLVATHDKRKIFISETKTKPARTHYPDTGINIKNYNDYLIITLAHNMDVLLTFVDEIEGIVYGGWMHELEQPRRIMHNNKEIIYPLNYAGIRYYPRCAMTPYLPIPPWAKQALAECRNGGNSEET